eukprot:4626931-Prymnesium_polylepis.1
MERLCGHCVVTVWALTRPAPCVRAAPAPSQVLPYDRLRVEVLPPDSRRTFDLQLEVSAVAPAGGGEVPKPLKLELSMLAGTRASAWMSGWVRV